VIAPVRGPSLTRVIGVIAAREAAAALLGLGIYIALTVALLAATWMLMLEVRALQSGGLIVKADPFRSPLAVGMLVLSIFLSLSAAVSVARERESGTLEVLFYGPVDEPIYVLGKVFGLVTAYIVALPLLLLSLWLLALLSGFALTASVVLGAALSIVPAAAILGFGVLLSIGASRVRTAVLLLVATAALLLGIAVAYRMVLLVPIEDPASLVLPLRDALAALDMVARWVSPFAYLERVVEGSMSGAWRTLVISLAAAFAYALAMVGLAAYWLRRQGVHRAGD
jgi:ABC-type transport system involved in multi-copper enzyme maturation permease subunit